jgi:hypothetical protein
MKENGKAAYLDTGTWSAAIEAKPFGETVVVASSKKITITFQKGIQYRMMQIIFTVLAITPFWNSKRISVIRHAYCMRYEF